MQENSIQSDIIKTLKKAPDLKKPWYNPIIRTLTLPFRIVAWPLRYILMSFIAPITRSHIMDFFRRTENQLDPDINKVADKRFQYNEIQYKTQGLFNNCKLVHAYNTKDTNTPVKDRKLVIYFGGSAMSMKDSIKLLEMHNIKKVDLLNSILELLKTKQEITSQSKLELESDYSNLQKNTLELESLIEDNQVLTLQTKTKIQQTKTLQGIEKLEKTIKSVQDKIQSVQEKNATKNDVIFVGYPKGATSSQELVDGGVSAVLRAEAAGYKRENITINGWSLGGAISATVLEEIGKKHTHPDNSKFASYTNDRSFKNLGSALTNTKGLGRAILNGLAWVLGIQLDAEKAIQSIPIQHMTAIYAKNDDMIADSLGQGLMDKIKAAKQRQDKRTGDPENNQNNLPDYSISIKHFTANHFAAAQNLFKHKNPKDNLSGSLIKEGMSSTKYSQKVLKPQTGNHLGIE